MEVFTFRYQWTLGTQIKQGKKTFFKAIALIVTTPHGQEVKQDGYQGIMGEETKACLFCLRKGAFPQIASPFLLGMGNDKVLALCELMVFQSELSGQPCWAPGEVREGWERGGGRRRPPASSSHGKVPSKFSSIQYPVMNHNGKFFLKNGSRESKPRSGD